MADETKVNQVTEQMDDLSFDPTMKKKKSKSKSVAFDDPSTAEVGSDVVPTEGKIWSTCLNA